MGKRFPEFFILRWNFHLDRDCLEGMEAAPRKFSKLGSYDWLKNLTEKIPRLSSYFCHFKVNSLTFEVHFQPGDSKSRESPDEADIVWRLFIQILFR